MGRCSGGLFGDLPLKFYSKQVSVRNHVLFQFYVSEELIRLKRYDLYDQKPFFISIESETQFYFVLTDSNIPNLVYHYDENEDTVKPTQWTFNEYLRKSIDQETRSFPNPVPPDRHGELIII